MNSNMNLKGLRSKGLTLDYFPELVCEHFLWRAGGTFS